MRPPGRVSTPFAIALEGGWANAGGLEAGPVDLGGDLAEHEAVRLAAMQWVLFQVPVPDA